MYTLAHTCTVRRDRYGAIGCDNDVRAYASERRTVGKPDAVQTNIRLRKKMSDSYGRFRRAGGTGGISYTRDTQSSDVVDIA